MLASPSTLRPRSGSSNTLGGLSGPPNSTSWLAPVRALFLVSLVALAAFPQTVSAAPPTIRLSINTGIDELHRRGQNDSQSSTGSISMSVWLPILIVTVVFVFFSFCTCMRRYAANNEATTLATANRAASTPASTTRPRQRPQRTPSQISTKSLPPYMKEPGDQELVLFRGPADIVDDHLPRHAMPMLAEDDDEHHEMHSGTFGIALDRIESVDTMADSSTANLIRRVSESVPRPPELHHATMPHDHHRNGNSHSLDSIGSEAELLTGHQRAISLDNQPDPRGEAPSYTEASEGRLTTVLLNHAETNHTLSNSTPSRAISAAANRARSRFSFLMHNPFSLHSNTGNAPSNVSPLSSSIRPGSPALHTGSILSRFSSRESHESHHSQAPSRNNLSRTHTRSSSNLLRAFRSHSPGLHPGSSTISLDSISAPLTHTVTRAEFHAPKGGLLTPEQIKLITSREALEKFGVPYGPDAVAAFSSRERLAEMGPPPEFEEEQVSVIGGGNGGTEAVVETIAQIPGSSDSDNASPRSTSPSPSPQLSLSPRPDLRGESRTSTDMSYTTAHVSDEEDPRSQAQTVQVYASDAASGTGGVDEPQTSRPTTLGAAH